MFFARETAPGAQANVRARERASPQRLHQRRLLERARPSRREADNDEISSLSASCLLIACPDKFLATYCLWGHQTLAGPSALDRFDN